MGWSAPLFSPDLNIAVILLNPRSYLRLIIERSNELCKIKSPWDSKKKTGWWEGNFVICKALDSRLCLSHCGHRALETLWKRMSIWSVDALARFGGNPLVVRLQWPTEGLTAKMWIWTRGCGHHWSKRLAEPLTESYRRHMTHDCTGERKISSSRIKFRGPALLWEVGCLLGNPLPGALVSVASSSPKGVPLNYVTVQGVARAGNSWCVHGRGDGKEEKNKKEMWYRCFGGLLRRCNHILTAPHQ